MLMEASELGREVRSSVTVDLPRDEAFRLFTERMGSWWPGATHSVYEADVVDVILEPMVGGRLYEATADGRTSDWGRVTAWEPVDRVAMTWHPGYDEALESLVEVTFSDADGGGTQVDLLHTGWEVHGADAEQMASGYQEGWPIVLAFFAKAA
jgi:uncharacterized protein YndB with AHSA1/START domain